MEVIMLPDAKKRIRSENHREYYQSKWFDLVRRLLFHKRGPFSLQLVAPPPAEKSAMAKDAPCSHPKEFIAVGANQYGRWSRCTKCQKKLSFQRYGPEDPPPQGKKKNVTQVTYVGVPKALPDVRPKRGSSTAASSSGMTREEVQAILDQQSRTMMEGVAASMTQALQPLVQSMSHIMQNQATMQTQQQQVFPPKAPLNPPGLMSQGYMSGVIEVEEDEDMTSWGLPPRS